MDYMKTDEIRKAYLEFFRSRDHEVVASDSLVPDDDPTLLFTGAGMNQFKEKFLGRNISYRRATSSQKCLRTGDLENVGRTSGHHTFFEMLGNFSFGDYFKKEAIGWAWEFLTGVLKIPEERLWASVYRDDQEAYAIWKDTIGVPGSKIMRFGEKENFWPSEAPSKGPNGPCGPCSEIFYDYGKDVGCGKPKCTPECDCGRFVEVWNLVFTQFDRQQDGKLNPLPNKNIDTGMGLERLASVMQGVKTNFAIDIFQPIVKEIEKSMVHGPRSTDQKKKINAIADHIRAITFTISDGAMPSNEERGYVVRKLIRRSLVYGNDIGAQGTFLYKLVSVVAEVMKRQYPELIQKRDDIAQVVKKEGEGFLIVIKTQVPKVDEVFTRLSKEKNKETLPEVAFNFYDTYGMPYDMLEELAEKHNLKIDRDRFDKLLEKQRQKSRAKSKIKGEIFTETFAKKVEALGLKTEFLGYEESHAEARVVAVLGEGEVILDRTPFYGESGGQVGDWGKIETGTGAVEIEDAKKIGETIVHIGRVLHGKIEKGQIAKVAIDEEVRKSIMRNHTATHLLQAALRKVLGDHVKQTGSLVDAEHLRFDFTHMKKMEEREIARTEELVNENIKKSIPVTKEIKDIEQAKAQGATALFGEKYEKNVRVVTIGNVSKELCGGTHVDNTNEIETFRITSEGSVASGVRRIEAVTGQAALKWVSSQKEADEARARLQEEKESLKRSAADKLKSEIGKLDEYLSRARDLGGTKLLCEVVDGATIDIIRPLADKIRQKCGSSVIVLATIADEKAAFVIAASDDVIQKRKLSAHDLAKDLAKYINGSGGGRPDFAQGGGKDPSQLENALGKICEIVTGRFR